MEGTVGTFSMKYAHKKEAKNQDKDKIMILHEKKKRHFSLILACVFLHGRLVDVMPVTVYTLGALLLAVEVTLAEFEVFSGHCQRTGLFQASTESI